MAHRRVPWGRATRSCGRRVTDTDAKQPTILMVDQRKDRPVTPFLWLLAGAGLGFISLEVVGIPLLVGCFAGLGARAFTRPRNTRYWADVAGLMFGAGVVASIFAVPESFIPSCSGQTFAGGCDASGQCWSTGPTSCTESHAALMVIAAVACLFMVCAVAIVVWLATRNSLTPRGRAVQ